MFLTFFVVVHIFFMFGVLALFADNHHDFRCCGNIADEIHLHKGKRRGGPCCPFMSDNQAREITEKKKKIVHVKRTVTGQS